MSDETKNIDDSPDTGEGFKQAQISVPFPESFVYSNVSAQSLSMLDLRISFAEATQEGKAHPRVGIVMPVEHAAALVLGLFKNLMIFEHTFGPIRNPEWRSFQEQAGSPLKNQPEQIPATDVKS